MVIIIHKNGEDLKQEVQSGDYHTQEWERSKASFVLFVTKSHILQYYILMRRNAA